MKNEHLETLNQLEEKLRQLKVQYDMFFAGSRPLPPSEDRKRLETRLRELESTRIRDNAVRFRFNNFLNKYTMLRELWGRQMREKEEGPMDYRKRAEALSEEARERAARERTPTGSDGRRVTSSDGRSYIKVEGSGDSDHLLELHRDLAAASRAAGTKEISLGQLSAMIDTQVTGLKKKYGSADIGFRVEVENGKVKLKARPLQEKS